MIINQKIVHHLLGRLRDLTEWGQCVVLQLVLKHVPESEDEMFQIMNVLDDRLKHSNSGVVMSTITLFLGLTSNYPEVHEAVYQRVCTPLITLMQGGTPELSFAVLAHISLLAERQPGVFDEHYKNFSCRYNDPSWVKRHKVPPAPRLSLSLSSSSSSSSPTPCLPFLTNTPLSLSLSLQARHPCRRCEQRERQGDLRRAQRVRDGRGRRTGPPRHPQRGQDRNEAP